MPTRPPPEAQPEFASREILQESYGIRRKDASPGYAGAGLGLRRPGLAGRPLQIPGDRAVRRRGRAGQVLQHRLGEDPALPVSVKVKVEEVGAHDLGAGAARPTLRNTHGASQMAHSPINA